VQVHRHGVRSKASDSALLAHSLGLGYRFALLDLDEAVAFDPLDVIRTLRMRYMINILEFCFAGDEEVRDEMRFPRADRFVEGDEILERIPPVFAQLGWTGAGD
jgi:hypothetical protein